MLLCPPEGLSPAKRNSETFFSSSVDLWVHEMGPAQNWSFWRLTALYCTTQLRQCILLLVATYYLEANLTKVKLKVDDTWYSASLWANSIIDALTYGTHFQGITQFYLPPTCLSTSGMNHTCLWLSSRNSKRGNINTAALVTVVQCSTLVARCSRQLIGPADWVFVTLGPLCCD